MASGIKKTVFLFFITFSAFAQNPNDITGKWKTEDHIKMQAEIYLGTDGLYYGKIIQDQDNPKTIGKIILKKLKYDNKSATYKGLMSPPDKDAELNATLSLENENKIKIVARKLILSKTIYFTRVK